ncbi:MAG: CBS domain-containing protein [Sporolactobacillus sp.]
MHLSNKFYFSRVIGRPVYQSDKRRVLGRIADFYVDTTFKRPKIVALKLRGGATLDISSIDIVKDHAQYAFYCNSLHGRIVDDTKTYLSLREAMLDKQIVDLDGRKVVRVNDLRFAVVSTGTFLIAADVGLEGLLRRLGVAKQMKAILVLFHRNIPSRLILWDDVETVESSQKGIKLTEQAKKINMLHPSDVADIIEDLNKDAQTSMFTAMDEEKAADVLEEMEPEAQVNVLNSLSVAKAVNVLEKMPSDEVADIFAVLNQPTANKLLAAMKTDVSAEIKGLMRYPENMVGSMMSTNYVSIDEDASVGDAFALLRREKPELDPVFFLYVIDKHERPIGAVSLLDLVVAPSDAEIETIMSSDVHRVHDKDKLEELTETLVKYNLPSVAVIDDSDKLIGVAFASDVLYYYRH